MLEVKDDWKKMEEISSAYEYGMPQVVPAMLKVSDDWKKMKQIRLEFLESKNKK
jgi:hypothetical protein